MRIILFLIFCISTSTLALECKHYLGNSQIEVKNDDDIFNFFMGADNLGGEIELRRNHFESYISQEFPQLQKFEIEIQGNLYSQSVESEFLAQIDETVDLLPDQKFKAISENIQKTSDEFEQKTIESFQKRFSNQIQNKALDESEIIANQTYTLSRSRLNINDPVYKVKFSDKVSKPLNKNPALKKKFVTAMNKGLVERSVGQNGIKHLPSIDSKLYEIKIDADARIWGCLDDSGLLILKNLTNHQGIKDLSGNNPCP